MLLTIYVKCQTTVLILIIACVFNIMSKLVGKLSLNDELLSSARYIFSKEEKNENIEQ